jgi:hypothetical protein
MSNFARPPSHGDFVLATGAAATGGSAKKVAGATPAPTPRDPNADDEPENLKGVTSVVVQLQAADVSRDCHPRLFDLVP